MEEEKKQGATSPIPHFITVTPTVNVNYPSYRDVLWIDYVYDNCALNWHYGPKALYNHFPNIQRRDYTVIRVKLEPAHY